LPELPIGLFIAEIGVMAGLDDEFRKRNVKVIGISASVSASCLGGFPVNRPGASMFIPSLAAKLESHIFIKCIDFID
jgi:hypothetical protein